MCIFFLLLLFFQARAKYEVSADIKRLEPSDVANAVIYAVTQPAHCAVNEILIEPVDAPCWHKFHVRAAQYLEKPEKTCYRNTCCVLLCFVILAAWILGQISCTSWDLSSGKCCRSAISFRLYSCACNMFLQRNRAVVELVSDNSRTGIIVIYVVDNIIWRHLLATLYWVCGYCDSVPVTFLFASGARFSKVPVT